MKSKIIYIAILMITTLFYSSCYKEQHFDLPGPYGDKEIIPDTLPFPFDSTRQAGIYLIKDGIPDYTKAIFKGYSDFVPRLGDTLSWYQENDRYTSRQCWNFYALDQSANSPEYFASDYFSYQYAQFCTKPFVKYFPGSKWYFYAKMSMPYVNACAPYYWFGGKGGFDLHRHVAGFDGANGNNGNSKFFAQINRQEIASSDWPLTLEVITPGEPFEMELVCVDYFVYLKVNGTLIWYYNIPAEEHSMPIVFCPWRNSVSYYDVYMEGDIEDFYDFVCNESENNYITIQSPALTKAANGDILLFAEGRVAEYELTSNADYAAIRTNATDIVMKSSSDNGTTWNELKTIVGNRNDVNIFPTALTDSDGKNYVLYTVDGSGHLDGSTYNLYQITSTNHGESWSNPQIITTSLQGEYAQSTVSGHGLEIKTGTHAGRLIALTYCVKEGQKTMAAIYSDNRGASWQSGEVVPVNNVTGGNIVELADGRLMIIMSHEEDANHKCKVSYSNDGGETWSEPVYGAMSTGNNGFRFAGATVAAKDGKIVHFTPNDRKSGFGNDENRIIGCPTYGYNFGVTIADPNGENWSNYEDVFTKYAYDGYYFLCRRMDAVALDDGRVLCITEGGVKCPKEGLIRFFK